MSFTALSAEVAEPTLYTHKRAPPATDNLAPTVLLQGPSRPTFTLGPSALGPWPPGGGWRPATAGLRLAEAGRRERFSTYHVHTTHATSHESM